MEFMSESSTDGKSFGLLDENLLQDITLSANSSENKITSATNKVKEKPPIPQTTRKKSLNNNSNTQQPAEFNELAYEQQNALDPAEETAVSIKLNESDLKQLDDEFTFADSDEDDENEDKENNRTLNRNSPTKQNKNDVFSMLFNKDIYKNDMILNESADILRNSNEFFKSNPMSYDMTTNEDESKLVSANNMADITLNQVVNSTRNENANLTLNFANETATKNRMNELVQQSVERIKRRVYGSFADIDSNDDYFSNLNASTNPTKEMLCNKQFSPASLIKPGKLYNNMSTTSNFEENNLTENANQTISFAAASVDLNPVESLKDTTLKDSSVASMSIYFKPQQESQSDLNETPTNQLKEEFPQQQQQQVTFVLNEDPFATNNACEDSMFTTSNKNVAEFNINDQANFKEFNDINSIEFKSGSDAFNCINQDEAENRMLETTVDQSSANNDTSSSDNSQKWWKKQDQQKLEQSKAQDYFEINSTLPSFLANKDPDTTYSMLKKDNKKMVESMRDANETLSDEKNAKSEDSDEITFSTTKNHLSDNFSFTLNASENGDFIIKKNQADSSKSELLEIKASTTPFQVSKMLNAYQQKKATASNLKTIGEELDRVSNRLAISNDSILKTTTITTALTTTTTTSDKSLKHKNNQLILTMDETISSINSSSNRSANLVKQQQKQKIASGSLTSTPSKHNKKAEKSSLKKEDQTEITSTTSNNLLNQASFISSIPERTNDSTLMGNHHHHHKSKRGVSKNAEIQTSPDKSSSSSSSSTASFSSDAPTKLAEEKTQNVLASQMVAINNLAASLLNNNNTNESNSNRTSLFNSSNNNGLIPVAFLPVDAVFPYVQKIYDNYQQKSQIDLSSNSMRQQASSLLFSELNNTAKFKLELPSLQLDRTEIDFGQIAEGCSDTSRLCIKLANTNLIQFNREHNITGHLCVELKDEDWSFEQGKQSLDDTSVKSKLARTLSVCADRKHTSSNRLKLDFVTNYYELYISLNTVDLNYFKDLIYHQQVDSRTSMHNHHDEQDKSLDSLNINTKLSIYYSFVDSTNLNSKYLLNHVSLKYTLGYAKLRSTVSMNLIEFDLAALYYSCADMATATNKSISSRSNNADVDKTLTSNCSKDDTCLSVTSTKNLVDQLIPLSNGGNIPININCYFVDDNDRQAEEQHKHRILSLKDNQFQLKIDKSILSLDAQTSASAAKKHFARLTLLKLSDSTQLVSFDDLRIRLILQVKPNGFKYEIPVRFKLGKLTQHASVSKLKKVASLDSTSSAGVSSGVSAKIASSKSIIFFGKTLNTNIKSCAVSLSDTGLVNEFLIRNLNDFKVKYELTLCTCINEIKSDDQASINMSTTSTSSFSTTLTDKIINKSSINLFKFTSDMKEFAPRDDASMTRLIIQVEPKEHASISVKFNSSLVEFDSKASAQVASSCYGLIKIATLGFNQKFNVFLVGFLNRSQLCLDSNENKLVKKSDLTDESSKLERYVCSKNIQLFNFKYQLASSVCDDYVCMLRKTIKLQNKSSSSRLIVYPAVFDLQRELNPTRIENQLVYNLDVSSESYTTKIKLVLDQNKLNDSASVSWIDLAPNEQVNLTLDVEFKLSNTMRKLSDLFERIEKRFDQLNLCLFWIEHDINMQCLNGAQFLQDMSTSSIESHVDVFVKKLLSLNPRSFNSPGAKLDPNFINSVITKKAKLQFDNLVCLMTQALKCSNLKLTLMFKGAQRTKIDDHSVDFTLSNNTLKEPSLLNDSSLSLNETKSTRLQRDDSWSILTDKITISNLNFDHVTGYTSKLTIRNNLARTHLLFNTAFNATVLDVEPNRGSIPPHKTLDLIVRARKDGVKQLPWDGKIVVISNKSEKEIPVVLFSTVAPTKLVSSKSFSESKLFKPPAPIPSFTLPTLSVKSKLNDQLSKNSVSSSSFSLTDSSPFVLSSTSASSTEQGTVISEITQNTIDSLSLTPLINASFHMHSSKLQHHQQQRTLKADESSIKILHFGNHAQIQFPPVCVSKSKTYDFTLINPTNNFVNWRAYTSSSQQLNNSNESMNLTTKFSSNVFKMTPSSGVIQANQKQIIKIEFSPRDECGNFQELWEIDTRASSPISYNCKIVISGRSILNEEDTSNVLIENSNLQTTRSFKSTNSLTKYKSKENFEPFRKDDSALTTKLHQKTISDYDQTIESNKSGLDAECPSMLEANSVSHRKITIKDYKIEFPDTPMGGKSKSYIVIDNKEDKRCNLSIISPMDPFYCKHLTISIESRHYIKVPIEFKPRVPGDYTEKILIRIDSTDMPLTCLVKAKCIHSI